MKKKKIKMDKWKKLKKWTRLWEKRYKHSMLVLAADKSYGSANRANAGQTVLNNVLDKMQKLEEEEKDGS